MISGMNTEMEFQGKIYHIQTEDGGKNSPVITTQVFVKGAILVTRKTNYADIVKANYLEAIVKDLMKQQHGLVIKELMSGRLLEKGTAQPSIKPASPAAQGSPAAQQPPSPPQKQDKSKKTLDDLILDYLVGKKEKEGS